MRGPIALAAGLALVAITYLLLGGPEAECGYELGACIPPGRWTMLSAIIVLLVGSGVLSRDSRELGRRRLGLVAISLSTVATFMVSWALRSSDRVVFPDKPIVAAGLILGGILCGLAAIWLSWKSVETEVGLRRLGRTRSPQYERTGSTYNQSGVPLQNRVTPFGEVLALAGRGRMVGNRGVLVNEPRTLARQWQVRRWIACLLAYKGIRRTVMQPHRWTELFFLDEATAFSAGHRPCAECRRADYKRFQTLWAQTRGEAAGADAMDVVLHAERLVDRKTKRTVHMRTPLPNGTYVVAGGTACVLWDGTLFAWSDAGYLRRGVLDAGEEVEVLTPPSVVAIFAAGYVPGIHPSAPTQIASTG